MPDLIFSLLQGIAVTGLCAGLVWILWELARHPISEEHFLGKTTQQARRSEPPLDRPGAPILVPLPETRPVLLEPAGRPVALDGSIPHAPRSEALSAERQTSPPS